MIVAIVCQRIIHFSAKVDKKGQSEAPFVYFSSFLGEYFLVLCIEWFCLIFYLLSFVFSNLLKVVNLLIKTFVFFRF